MSISSALEYSDVFELLLLLLPPLLLVPLLLPPLLPLLPPAPLLLLLLLLCELAALLDPLLCEDPVWKMPSTKLDKVHDPMRCKLKFCG